jgi:integrase
MPKLTKRIVESALPAESDYVLWDEELPGFGLRVFASGRRSYLIQYRSAGRSRRYTIGLHGIWTPEMARQEAKAKLGRIAQGDDPAETRLMDHQAITVRTLCERYIADMEAGLILGRRRTPKKPRTISSDISRINAHIIPLIGTRRVKDFTKADTVKFMRDIMTGKSRRVQKTDKLRGKSIIRGGAGTASRTVGLLGGIFSYAIELGVIEHNPAHGVSRPKDNVRQRRLSQREYRLLGDLLRLASNDCTYEMTVEVIRLLAMTGARRSEIIGLMWTEIDWECSCLRLEESKTGFSVRPVGLPVIELLEERSKLAESSYVFPSINFDNAYGGLARHWRDLFRGTSLSNITPHVLRHSFASLANDLGFTEVTIAALVGHAQGSITSRYIHSIDANLVSAADTMAAFIQGLLDGKEYQRAIHSLDRSARKQVISGFLNSAQGLGPQRTAVADRQDPILHSV